MQRQYMDDVLQEIGSSGPYQLRLFGLILLPILFNAIYNAQYVFCAAPVDYRCAVPECESGNEFATGEWSEWALVRGEQCVRYECAAEPCSCSREGFSNSTAPCQQWVYASHNTIVSEFGLACHEWKRALVGTIHSVGVFTALTFVGIVSDSIGRRTTFIMTSTLVAAAGLARSFSPSYLVYIILEYLDALIGSGSYNSGFILGMEMIHPKKRVLGGFLMSTTFAIGQALLALVAWLVPYWRSLLRVLYIPSFFFIFYFFLIDESIRWLLSTGKEKRAKEALFRAAKFNKRQLSPQTLKNLTDTMQENQSATTSTITLFKRVMSSRILMQRLAVCSFCWVTITFVYYGLSINSVSLAGNMYLNYALTALAEIPGYVSCLFVLDRFGRKRSIMTALLICGFTLIILPFLPALHWSRGALSMAAKSCISMAFSGVYLQVSELFPTGVRNSAMSFCSMMARLGMISAMLTPLLMKFYVWLPYLLFGLMSVSAALLLTLTPETLRTRLPDTVAQAEVIQRGRKHAAPMTTHAADGHTDDDVKTHKYDDKK